MSGKQWKPGQSGNPGGRQKGIERLFQDAIAQLKSADGSTTGLAVLLARLEKIALFGEEKESLAAIKLWLERAYGQPKQKVEITGDGDSAAGIDWSRVPIELRRELLVALAEPDGTSTEH